MSYQAASYLRSGSNELKVLEYVCGGVHFGINVLKSSRILNLPTRLTRVAGAHHAVLGIFHNLGVNLPVIDLVAFLGLPDKRSEEELARRRVIVTEFFGQNNSFVIDHVERIYDLSWTDVQDASKIMDQLGSAYVLGMVNRGDNDPILLLDYERIILDINPDAASIQVPTDTAIIQEVAVGSLEKRRKKIEQATLAVEPQRIPDSDDSIGTESSATVPPAAAPISTPSFIPTILVAEDSKTVRNLVVSTLQDRGYQVIGAADGAEAKKIFDQDDTIALVLTDVEMPQMDGLSLTQAIRDVDSDIPVILHSSIGDMGMKERARAVKANSHITKFNMEELVRTIDQFMEAYEVES